MIKKRKKYIKQSKRSKLNNKQLKRGKNYIKSQKVLISYKKEEMII